MKRNSSKDLKDLQGMHFTKDGITFKASQIKRGLSFTAIISKLESNATKEQQRTTINQQQTSQTELPKQETHYEHQEHEASPVCFSSLGLFETTNLVCDPAEEEFRRQMQWKKKKKHGLRL